MTRNKTIALLHDVTGVNYSELRRELKANKWNMYVVYVKVSKRQLTDLFGVFNDNMAVAIQKAAEAFGMLADSLADAVNNAADALKYALTNNKTNTLSENSADALNDA